MAIINPDGSETLDDTPVAIPLRIKKLANDTNRIRDIIRQEMSRAAEAQGLETFEESDDFDVGDDFDPTSPYELDFDQEVYNGELATQTHEEPQAQTPPPPQPPEGGGTPPSE